jgi:hypothetical protein
MNDIKETLLNAVPPLSAPPDRLAAIRNRARARRRMNMTGTALAALASVVALGTTMAVLTPADPESFGVAPAGSGTEPRPSMSPGERESGPPKDFPMPAPGNCPQSVKLGHMPTVDAYSGGTLPPISGVTLCRYSQNSYALDEGENSLTSGPGSGDVNTFRNALVKATLPDPASSGGGPPWASGSASGLPSASASSPCPPGPVAPPPWTIDVLFVHSPDGTTRAVILHRYTCDPPLTDPMAAVWTAVDAVLGRPYR